MLAGGSAAVQFWKDQQQSQSAAVGMGLPGAAATDDLLFATRTGGSWFERMRLTNAGHLLLGDPVAPNNLILARLQVGSSGPALIGRSAQSHGLYGVSDDLSGSGVIGLNTANNGVAVSGEANVGGAAIGVQGKSSGGAGVMGNSSSATGVVGLSGVQVFAPANNKVGVFGKSVLQQGIGVVGEAMQGTGVVGEAMQGTGVLGKVVIGTGVSGQSSQNHGVLGATDAINFAQPFIFAGVHGIGSAESGVGVYGVGGGHGVRGSSSNGFGVYGKGQTGVYGEGGFGGYGVLGFASMGSLAAGRFVGAVEVTGNLSKGGGSFKIDHPLDPANKYLYHSFVESPDMMNIYNGVVALDAQGEAIVTLPDYFDALNRDFRYQLTCIGGFAPVYVAAEIAGNQFKIAGGSPGLKVSWQVTGVRQDAFANKHRIPVEEDKPAAERGHYLHPAAFNQPEEKSIEWGRQPEMMKRRAVFNLSISTADVPPRKPQ